MSDRSWSEIVDSRAKTFELAAMFNAAVKSDTAACGWHAQVLRELARLADRAARGRAHILGTIRLLGLKFTIARDG